MDGDRPTGGRRTSWAGLRAATAGAPVLLFVGRLSPNKAQHHLVEALWLSRLYDPDARLHLVGPAVTRVVHAGGVRLAEELGLARRPPRRATSPRGAGRLVRRRRRLRVPLRPRGVLHPPARGHAVRAPHRGLRRRGGARDVGRRRPPARLKRPAWWPRPSTASDGDPAWPSGWSRPGTGGWGRSRCPRPARFVEVLAGLAGAGRAAGEAAFVTPRYGIEVIGGAETGARMLAERLAFVPGWEVEVMTSWPSTI